MDTKLTTLSGQALYVEGRYVMCVGAACILMGWGMGWGGVGSVYVGGGGLRYVWGMKGGVRYGV